MAGHLPLRPGQVVGGRFATVRELVRGDAGALWAVTEQSSGDLRSLRAFAAATLPDGAWGPIPDSVFAAVALDRGAFLQPLEIGAEDSGDPFIVWEGVRGPDLRTLLRARGAFSVADALDLIEPIGAALSQAHAAGHAYGLLGAERAFYDPDTTVLKLADFGLSSLFAPGPDRDDLSPAWSWAFLDPDQLSGDVAAPASDVWALALLAFTLVTGRSYWSWSPKDGRREDLVEEMRRHPLPRATARAQEVAPGVALPSGFDDWFDRAVRPSRSDRFQQADASLTALRASVEPPRRSSGSGGAAYAVTLEAELPASSPEARDLSATPPGDPAGRIPKVKIGSQVGPLPEPPPGMPKVTIGSQVGPLPEPPPPTLPVGPAAGPSPAADLGTASTLTASIAHLAAASPDVAAIRSGEPGGDAEAVADTAPVQVGHIREQLGWEEPAAARSAQSGSEMAALASTRSGHPPTAQTPAPLASPEASASPAPLLGGPAHDARRARGVQQTVRLDAADAGWPVPPAQAPQDPFRIQGRPTSHYIIAGVVLVLVLGGGMLLGVALALMFSS